MRTLHGKFFVVIALLVLGIGGLGFYVQSRTINHYSLAMTQILNETLAKHLVTDFFEHASPSSQSESTIRQQFSHMMDLNPNIDIYLLSKDGGIEAFTAPDHEVQRKQVDLKPIMDFISHKYDIPILGDDPRDMRGLKIFSAALLDQANKNSGYLYVVLGGAEYDAAAQRVQGALYARGAFTILGLSVIVALLAAFFVLLTMTRKLRHLTRAIHAFKESRFLDAGLAPIAVAARGDELDRLAQVFKAMAVHIRGQMQELAQSNMLRRELIAGVSHDLRTPLASLRGYLETLMIKNETASAEDRRNYLGIAFKQCESINKLVAELFELAKLDEPGFRLELEPIQLSELVQDVLQKFGVIAQSKSIQLIGDYLPEGPLFEGDISLLERMLDNFIGNAIRHTSAGGRVRVGISLAGQTIRLEISDTGSGIASEDIPFVFDRLFQSGEIGGAVAGGAGLGLTIAARIAQLHRAQIRVRSKVGVGTSFYVELPLSASHLTGC